MIADLRQIDAPSSHRSRLLSKMANHLLFIVDDNLFSDRRYLIELLTRMRSFRKRWYTQAPAWVGTDPELLHHLRRAGCIILAIGFESVVSESLKQMRKTFNRPARYREIVRRIRNAGIMVAGSFVLGFDGDGPGVFDDTLTFADQAGLDLASFHILTPYPGTPFFERVVREDRLLAPLGDWRRFDTQHVVFRPAKMSPEALQEGFDRLWVEFTSLRSIRLRGRMTPNPLFFWPLNLFQNSLMTTSLVRIRRPAPDRAPAVEDGRWALSAVN